MKTYIAKNFKSRVCFYLMTYRIAFRYDPKSGGIEFQASNKFVKELRDSLLYVFGSPNKPDIIEK